MRRILEVCTPSFRSVAAAVEGGAERIELCSALPLDGMTPSAGLLATVRETFPKLKVHVLIRPNEDGFCYSNTELDIMERDIIEARRLADGIVVGALHPDGSVNLEALHRFVEAARGLPVTFHRAFDVCADPLKALEDIIQAGCRRILTSGQQPTAEQGIPLLQKLCEQAGGRIIIMPGGGVNPSNVEKIVRETGCSEIHGSASDTKGITSARSVADIIRTLDHIEL